ncbi:MAG: tRNA uracil 4-sulfurtransferase ThiI, partial [Candidatus Kariarchaeaceae archaeon]
VILETEDENAVENLQKVFGVASFSIADEVPLDIEEIKKHALKLAKEKEFTSFKVKTQRMDKAFPMKSPEISGTVGEFVQKELKKEVKLKNPDLTIHVEIIQKRAFLFTDTVQGPGGLPVGSAGKVLSLLSGGIDSPVSSILMMKRGCSVDFIHFHNFPYVKKESIDKIKELYELTKPYQNSSKLIMVPFTDVQKEIVTKCPSKYRILLYRRIMLKIAEKLSTKHKAIVSGESLGQVSSQTLENMYAVGKATNMLFLRPLVGMDKIEIMDLAQKYGTFETSIKPHEDCCTYFVPRDPETKVRLKDLELSENELDVDKLINDCMEKIEIIN